MKAIIWSISIALVIPWIALARLGESLSEARNRYGQEASSEGSQPINTTYTAIFEKDPLRIKVTFAEYGPGDTQAIEINYTRTDDIKWTNDELIYLFKINSEGYNWGEQKDRGRLSTWSRSDGGTATFNAREQSLTIISAESIKRKPAIPIGLEGL